MVWENVPGAFSSNKGEDFRCVLEEICRVADAEVSIPRHPKNKWSNSGTIMGDGYSVAWRVLDAQYWGVPQRRKRIYLVADFGGESAPQILFKQDSMRGNFKESIEEREGTPGSPENGTNKSDRANVDCFDISVGNEGDPAYTLTTADKHSVAYSIDRAAFNQGANAKYDISIQKDLAQTLVAKGPSAVMHESFAKQGFGEYKSSNVASSLKQRDSKDATDSVVAFEPGTVSRIGGHFYEDGKTGTLRADPGDNQQAVICNDDIKYIIRRLTPTECGRLQGFPDGWADNLKAENITEDDIDYWKLIFQQHTESLGIVKKDKTDNQIKKWLSNPESDTAKYKMWGNGIALPCAAFVMEGIAHELQRRSMKEITINVPDGTQLLHLLAVIDKGKEIHYEAKFCDLRDGKSEYTLDSCNKEGE